MINKKLRDWYNKFNKTGVILPIKFGLSIQAVKKILGQPDNYSTAKMNTGRSHILIYNQIEFHFDIFDNNIEKLWLIYKDNPDGIVELCIKSIKS
ncbi:MAG: hypothetical protein WC801_03890 [Patescibacteria group bacterium]|jgi:hypothetical protein